MSGDHNFHQKVTSWGDGVVKPSHRIHLQTWLDNPLTKALKQSHKRQLEEYEVLLRQALETLERIAVLVPKDDTQVTDAIAALKERLE